MDTITHIALGACIGELFTDKQFGKRAMIWGALAQSIPDIDFIAGFWLSPTEDLVAHRSFTHSILFAILISFFLALAAERFHRPHNISLRKWILFLGTEVFVHLLLDGFNNYGVGWFEPFTHQRFSFNSIYVADPFFSISSGIICIYLIFQKSTHHKRIVWARRALMLTGLYLIYALFNKFTIENDVKKITKEQRISYQRHFTTPSPFNTWLWFVVLEKREGYYAGYRSVFDKTKTMDLHWYPKNEFLLKEIADHEEVIDLKQFSQGFYTVEKKQDTLVFNDLRFGQVIGWHDPSQPFAFHYYLNHPEDNNLVVQRGRFAKINTETLKSFWRKIKGVS